MSEIDEVEDTPDEKNYVKPILTTEVNCSKIRKNWKVPEIKN